MSGMSLSLVVFGISGGSACVGNPRDIIVQDFSDGIWPCLALKPCAYIASLWPAGMLGEGIGF